MKRRVWESAVSKCASFKACPIRLQDIAGSHDSCYTCDAFLSHQHWFYLILQLMQDSDVYSQYYYNTFLCIYRPMLLEPGEDNSEWNDKLAFIIHFCCCLSRSYTHWLTNSIIYCWRTWAVEGIAKQGVYPLKSCPAYSRGTSLPMVVCLLYNYSKTTSPPPPPPPPPSCFEYLTIALSALFSLPHFFFGGRNEEKKPPPPPPPNFLGYSGFW